MCEAKMFYPGSRKDFKEIGSAHGLGHPFNDLRLKHRLDKILYRMEQSATSNISRFSQGHAERISVYRFLRNPRVQLCELIHEVCQIRPSVIAEKDLLVPIDSSSCNLSIGSGRRYEWVKSLGVIDDNRSPGLAIMPSLVLDAHSRYCYGLGDILFHSRSQAPNDAELKKELRKQRAQLALEDKEAGAWSIVACNTAEQLQTARRVTFIMDQGADSYESIARIQQQTQRDFILRLQHNRSALDCATGRVGKLQQLLDQSQVKDRRLVAIKSLNHISKTTQRRVRRKKRKAKLDLKMIQVELAKPYGYAQDGAQLKQSLWLIQVKEDQSSVPLQEDPIEWKLLTTWPVQDLEKAWEVVQTYQYRWDIEQLFRILKKQAYDIERSQLDHPERIKKLMVMALKASSKALALVAARDGQVDIDIKEQFSESEINPLKAMSKQYNGNTDKTSNPFKEQSLAWAAWIIARAGGWAGYQSQRPPGPITMTRGLQKLDTICLFMQVNNLE